MAVMRLCFPNQTVDRLGGWLLLYLISQNTLTKSLILNFFAHTDIER